jgi:uroporphyrinogen decarboxylase
MITPLENFRRMMQREDPQWLPLMMSFTAPAADKVRRHIGEADPANYFRIDFRQAAIIVRDDPDAWRRAYAAVGVDLPLNATIVGYGIVHLVPPRASLGEAYHLVQLSHPLAEVQSIEALQTLPWPTVQPDDAPRLADFVHRAHAEGRVAIGFLECTIFETAWYLRGMENLLLDLVEQNPVANWLLDRITQRSVDFVKVACAAGVDVIALGDDVGTQRGLMMSLDFWRQHLKPRLRRVIDAIRNHQRQKVFVRYHSDGDVRPIIADLIEIGVDILNPVQPECMPVGEVIPRFRDRLGFWGMVGTQTTMPFGTAADVEAVVADLATRAKAGAAIVVAPTHVIEPDVPWENIAALAEAVRRTRLA